MIKRIRMLFNYGQNDKKKWLNPQRIGVDETFSESSILIHLISMGFGCSFSLTQVEL